MSISIGDATSVAAVDRDDLEREFGGEERLPFRESRRGGVILGALPFAIIVGLWAILSSHRPNGWRFAVPKFDATMHAVWLDLFVNFDGWRATEATLEEALIGLLIAAAGGILLGTLLGLMRTIEVTFYPTIIAFNAVPKVAIAPLLLLIFGFGPSSKIALAATVAFFPVLVSTRQGMGQMRLDEIDLLRSLEASAWQVFYKVRLPRAIPSIFAGIQVGLVFALIGAVVGELVGGYGTGFGYLITIREARLDVPGMYSALIILSLVGVVLTLLIRTSDRLFSNWQES
jgi:NitT/TauT family transport system permease protein